MTGPTQVCNKCGAEFPATAEFFHCDKSKKLGVTGACKTCKNQIDRDRYAANPEMFREKGRRYCQSHPDKERERHRRYATDHPEQNRDGAQRWRASNPEKSRGYASRQYAQNPEAFIARNRARRAKERGSEGRHTAEDVRDQYSQQKGRCFYCNTKVGDEYHVDHVVPLSLGGSNGPENLVIACPDCNRHKHNKHPMDWCGRMF